MRFKAWLDGLAVGGQRLGRAAPHFPVADPAARLHHTGGGQILQVDHHPWGEAVEVTGAVRLVGQHAGQFQGLGADVDVVANLQVHCRKQPRLGPGFAGFRAAACLLALIQVRRAFQFAA